MPCNYNSGVTVGRKRVCAHVWAREPGAEMERKEGQTEDGQRQRERGRERHCQCTIISPHWSFSLVCFSLYYLRNATVHCSPPITADVNGRCWRGVTKTTFVCWNHERQRLWIDVRGRQAGRVECLAQLCAKTTQKERVLLKLLWIMEEYDSETSMTRSSLHREKEELLS